MNMTINDVSLSDYGATLLSADYGYSKVTNYNDWLRGAKKPLSFGQDITYTTAKYTILVEGKNLAETDKNCSDIYSAMTKAIVKVDGSDWSVDGHLTSANESNRISPLAREIEVEIEGVKTGGRKQLTHTFALAETWTPEIEGNAEVPCVITIDPNASMATLLLTIDGKQYRINSVSSTLVIDSEQGLVTIDGENAIEKYESWELPHLKGGSVAITSNGVPTVKIEYNGRWM